MVNEAIQTEEPDKEQILGLIEDIEYMIDILKAKMRQLRMSISVMVGDDVYIEGKRATVREVTDDGIRVSFTKPNGTGDTRTRKRTYYKHEEISTLRS